MPTATLPPEIEDEIFEIAARLAPSSAHFLSIISKRVQIRVEMIMYETLVIAGQGFPPGKGAILPWRIAYSLRIRSAEFFAVHVRNICLHNTVPNRIAQLLLIKCTGIRNLALWTDVHLIDKGSWILSMSSTLETLYTTRAVLNEMADDRIVLPNLKFLGVRLSWPKRRLPALHWLPALEIIQLELDGNPILMSYNSKWFNDVKTVISTTPNLCLLVLDVFSESLEFTLHKLVDLPVETVVRNTRHHFHSIQEWQDALAIGILEWWSTTSRTEFE